MREVFGLMYRNSNGHAMAAVMTANDIDWRVYIGGCPAELDEQEAGEWVAKYGDKLSLPYHNDIITGLLKNGGLDRPWLPYGN